MGWSPLAAEELQSLGAKAVTPDFSAALAFRVTSRCCIELTYGQGLAFRNLGQDGGNSPDRMPLSCTRGSSGLTGET